jgi:histidinol phosphatase-like PHP family hydrolase
LFIPGVEITHADPRQIPELAAEARQLGAKIIVCHGETIAEPVINGTNYAAVSTKGLVDILAHPGKITEEDALLAKENGVYLELTSRKLHNATNKHVASIAKKTGAKMVINTDSHRPEDYITQETAFKLAKSCGLNDEEAKIAVDNNPRELLERLGFKIP